MSNELLISSGGPMQKDTSSTRSPFHIGEQKIQERFGIRDKMERFGRQVIRDHLPEQHQDFYSQLPFVFVGHGDKEGWPWASILCNSPGFIQPIDDRSLNVTARPVLGDPLSLALTQGTKLGLLGIELPSRRRNRLSAHVIEANENGVQLAVDQSFGNCPQYIQAREIEHQDSDSTSESIPESIVKKIESFDQSLKELIATSDTFFVASYLADGSGNASEGADVSHRGGRPGFVRVDDDRTLTIPDYLGNNHFNTFGNFLENGKAGLLFLDFERGHVLTLTGTVEILWDSPEAEHFEGAQSLWRFHLDHGFWSKNSLPLRWKLDSYSPNSLLTGTWSEAEEQQRIEKQRDQWQSYEVSNIVDESSVIRSFYLKPKTSQVVAKFEAGQFLTIKLPIGGKEVIRTYTVSSAPADTELRISIKREPSIASDQPEGLFSNFAHDNLQLGSVVQAKAPTGAFTFDAADERPAVLLAGGVGITPMVSMARHALMEGFRTRSMRPVTLINAATNVEQRAFFDELNQLAAQSSGGIRSFWCLSQVERSSQAGVDYHHSGRISKEFLQAVLPLDNYQFYLCGPQAFMQSMYNMLRELGINDSSIDAEEFGPASLKRDKAQETALLNQGAEASEAIITFSDSQVEQAWSQADGNLLDFAESHGISPEYGCRSGQCGACKTTITAGRVITTTAVSYPLNDDEILLCCSVPAAEGDDIVRLEISL
mgnify:CR=1 FL=1|tara:strand:- start:1208 stop:3346 length:2139 start_codon:yes stop_codon:yes gene_type:complete